MTSTRTTALVPAGTWQVDPAHSSVEFSVKHMGIANVRGRFTDFQGTVEVGKDAWSALRGRRLTAAEKLGPCGDPPSADYLARLEQASVINTLGNLLTFPRLGKLAACGRVALHGAYFAVATGELLMLDQQSGQFVPAASGAVRA